MPIHTHRRDFAFSCLTEDRSPGVDPFPGAAAAEGAAELRRKPRSRLEDLAGLEAHLSLMDGDVLPVAPDRREPRILMAEGGFLEHRVRREHRCQQLDVPPLPSLPESVDQLPVAQVHGAPNIPQSGTHAPGVCMTGGESGRPDREYL